MAVKEEVLALLQQNQAIYSGEKIAQELGVSRTAIWKGIKELEKAGWQIDHTPTGYRLLPSDVLSAEGILGWQKNKDNPTPEKTTSADNLLLSSVGLPTDLAIQIFDETPSTMQEAKKAVAKGQTTPRLLITESQTGGHGRFGRPFFSPKGQGIYMTLLLHPNHPFQELPQYTLLAAVAACRGIAEVCQKECQIKWVNDLYLEGKKIAGILTEATSDIESGTISYVSIGMGLNFAIAQEDFPAELQEKATSIYPNGLPDIPRTTLIQAIWRHFFHLLAALPEDTSYLEEYRRRSLVLGKIVSFTQNKQLYTGIAQEITDEGQLVVKTPEKTFTLNSGEISLTKIGG